MNWARCSQVTRLEWFVDAATTALGPDECAMYGTGLEDDTRLSIFVYKDTFLSFNHFILHSSIFIFDPPFLIVFCFLSCHHRPLPSEANPALHLSPQTTHPCGRSVFRVAFLPTPIHHIAKP